MTSHFKCEETLELNVNGACLNNFVNYVDFDGKHFEYKVFWNIQNVAMSN